MRERTKSFHIRFTEKEYQLLCHRAKQARLPKSTYVRFMIKGCCPKEKPDDRYWIVMRQLIGISNNLNQLAQKAHALGFIDVPMLKNEAKKWSEFRFMIDERYLTPEPVNITATLERGKTLEEQEGI